MKTIEEIGEGYADVGEVSLRHGGAILLTPYCRYSAVRLAELFKQSLLKLSWETKRPSRHEYFMSLKEREYSYGNDIAYHSHPFTDKA